MPGVVTDLHVSTDLHIPVALRGGGSPTAWSPETTGSSESSALLSLNQLHFLDNGWNVVPSVANETGGGYARGHSETAWDFAGEDFSSDWFFV